MNQAKAQNALNTAKAPKDDLFEGSTMTFGEHLEELRKSLLKAAVWLAFGLAIGLYFADRVVQFVQVPLEGAITRFMADQTLYKMDIDPHAADAQPMKRWLIEKGMIYETIYMVDEKAVEQEEAQRQENEQKAKAAAAAKPKPAAAAKADTAKKSEKEPAAKPDDEAKPAAKPKPTGAKPSAEPAKPTAGETEAKATEATGGSLTTIDAQVPDAVFENPEKNLKPVTIWRSAGAGLSSFQMEEPFMIWLKAGLVIGAIIGSPGIFFHIWNFVAAGLYEHERKYVYIYMPFSVVLFVSGVVLAFFLVLQYVLDFLLTFNATLNVDLVPRLSNYVNFVLLLPLGFGIAFQLPLVMLFLQRIGLFATEAYISSWRIAVLVIAVLSMILTPADIYSMIALMVPLILLYFLGIGLCKFMPKGRGIGSQGYDPA
ncbi:Sec-independent protein translocase protein TatCy [Rosistilla oblonga]|uniref:twin-arginine translocase subunit TatC n=1 Tax=Rosistilla oblonga TaxID=2527990 RepID=UPI00118A40DC|nr:twin-arginine translocase subunit TatC [Rosistilla oblonga]QDV10334.1 Sec-independent protein translocase protein TatCy [Rosistilla oblonga]